MERVNEEATLACESGPVELDVIVGEGQTGSISVDRDGEEIAEGVDTLEDVELGTCEDLEDATITVRATVNVVNPQSGRTSLTCVVHSDGEEHEDTFPGPELAVGGAVLFKIRCSKDRET